MTELSVYLFSLGVDGEVIDFKHYRTNDKLNYTYTY